MIDVCKKNKKERKGERGEALVRRGRKVRMPAIQMSVGRIGVVKEV